MNQSRSRLSWLLFVLVVLAMARWKWTLHPADEATLQVMQAMTRPPHSEEDRRVLPRPATRPADLPDWEEESAGNAFTPRTPPLPPPIISPSTIAAIEQKPTVPPTVIETPTRLVAPRPPLKVVGTWEDTAGFGVFVAMPSGTALARPGSVLMGEYSVTAVTPQTLSLQHTATRLDFQIPVPRASGS